MNDMNMFYASWCSIGFIVYNIAIYISKLPRGRNEIESLVLLGYTSYVASICCLSILIGLNYNITAMIISSIILSSLPRVWDNLMRFAHS